MIPCTELDIWTAPRPVSALRMLPDGTALLGLHDGQLWRWPRGRSAPLRIPGHGAQVIAIEESGCVISRGMDGLACWSTVDFARTRRIQHTAPVDLATGSADGERLLTAARDGLYRVWRGDEAVAEAVIVGDPWPDSGVFSADGTSIYTCRQGLLHRWRCGSWLQAERSVRMERPIRSLQCAADVLAVGVGAAGLDEVRLLDAVSLDEIARCRGVDGIDRFGLSPDGHRLLILSGGILQWAGRREPPGCLFLYNTRDGSRLARMVHGSPGDFSRIRDASFSPTTDTLWSWSEDGRMCRWSLRDGSKRPGTVLAGARAYRIGIDPEGRWICTADAHQRVRIWATGCD